MPRTSPPPTFVVSVARLRALCTLGLFGATILAWYLLTRTREDHNVNQFLWLWTPVCLLLIAPGMVLLGRIMRHRDRARAGALAIGCAVPPSVAIFGAFAWSPDPVLGVFFLGTMLPSISTLLGVARLVQICIDPDEVF